MSKLIASRPKSFPLLMYSLLVICNLRAKIELLLREKGGKNTHTHTHIHRVPICRYRYLNYVYTHVWDETDIHFLAGLSSKTTKQSVEHLLRLDYARVEEMLRQLKRRVVLARIVGQTATKKYSYSSRKVLLH